jgi:hypothetical protein
LPFKGSLPRRLRALRALISKVHTPLLSGSSSLLEDAMYEPFITKMIKINSLDTRFQKQIG